MESAAGIHPYSYEPEYTQSELEKMKNAESSDSDTDDSDEVTEGNGDEDRHGLGWCTCGECAEMPAARERVCCQDWEVLQDKLAEKHISCICLDDSIKSMVNPDVLLALYISFLMWKRSGERAPESLNNRQSRLMAYRYFVAWAHRGERLGRGRRRVIPSCVVKFIRQRFPEKSGTYTGFKEYREAMNFD